MKTLGDLLLLVLSDDANESERLCVGDRTADIYGIHALIILERLVERVHAKEDSRDAAGRLGEGNAQGICFSREPAAP